MTMFQVRKPPPVASIGPLLDAALQHHQAGRLQDAEKLYRQVLELDPEQPDGLHLLGVLASQVGRADIAVPLIERAVQHRPTSAAFVQNLGVALLGLGRNADAVACYHRACELAPSDPEAHYNLGNALIVHGEFDAGMLELRRALSLNPAHCAAQYNLGNALRSRGCLAEAADAYRAVIDRLPDHADAWTNLGTTLHQLDSHEEARDCFERAAALRPDDLGALLNLAEALRAVGELEASAERYELVLSVMPDNLTALKGLAQICTVSDLHSEAAELYGRAVEVQPDDLALFRLQSAALVSAGDPEAAVMALEAGLTVHPGDVSLIHDLVDLLQQTPVLEPGPAVRAALLAAVTNDRFDIQRLATPIARIILAAPEYEVLKAAAETGIDPFETSVPLPTSLTQEPAVLAALPRVVICAPEIERILTGLRRAAFLRATEPPEPSLAAQPLPPAFLAALAGAAFLVEHAWLVQADEAARLASLQSVLASLLSDPTTDPTELEHLLLLAALYCRLGTLSGADRLAEVPGEAWSAELAEIIREHVVEPIAEMALAAELPVLTPISDATSQAVRSMYEASPYPRWRAARYKGEWPLRERHQQLCPDETVPDWPSPVPVLVAGCGTGQHPIQSALRMPESAVLAIDLSRTSLGYGARMTQKLGVGNVRFAHADILAMGDRQERYALIESAGVLHHLADPMAGWRVLRGLLRPDGLMRIALYSERARASVVAARALLAEAGIPSTLEGVRAARRKILDLPADHPAATLVKFWDFYSASGFRDLAMHVQEHRYTLPRIAEALDELDLEFLSFEMDAETLGRFRVRFPALGAERDLACWDAFEADAPDTFASMYQFWCRPRAAG